MVISRTPVTKHIKVRLCNQKQIWIRPLGIKGGQVQCQNHFSLHLPADNMSVHQIELRAARYHRLLTWFGDQHDLAPINAIHNALLWQIYQFLVDHADTWGSPDIQNLCVMGDAIVGLYDRPQDVINLTRDDNDGAEQGSQANDSGIAD
jgi:hypothetical protein